MGKAVKNAPPRVSKKTRAKKAPATPTARAKKARAFRKVTRSAYYTGIRHSSGGPLHFAHGFDELADALGAPRDEVVRAVHSRGLNPLHLRQLVAAQACGIEWACNPSPAVRAAMGDAPEQVWSDLKCVAWRHGRVEPPKGSSDVWCLCSDDIALATGRTRDVVRSATKSARSEMIRHDFPSVLAWVRSKLPPDVLAALTGEPVSGAPVRAHGAVLDDSKVRAIRTERAAGAEFPALAKQYGVSIGSIRKVISGLTWKHVT